MSEANETKAPTSLKRGLPPEQNCGLFGAEDKIMALGVDGRFEAVVVLEVADIVHSEADGTRRPVVEFVHIEPIWDPAEIEAVTDVRETARAIRAGETQLSFDGLDGETPDPDAPARPEPQWAEDVEPSDAALDAVDENPADA